MKDFFQTHIQIFIIVIAIFLFGTSGYYFIEDDWTIFESFYMTAITITTVGYGETKPLSDIGRGFTIILIFLGLGSAAVFATQLAKTFLEKNFKDIFGANKMKNQIGRLNNHFIVCGFGDIGSSICSVLDETNIPFVVIEADDEAVRYAIQRQFLVVQGKATYDTTLMQSGIKNASGIVICLGDDSINMHVSLAAREINPDIFIIARGYKPHVEKRMIRAGANTIVNPLKLGGEQIAELIVKQYSKKNLVEELMISKSSIMGYALKMYQHFQVKETSVQQVKDKLQAVKVLKLRKSDGMEINNPPDDTRIQHYETILLLVNEEESLTDTQNDISQHISLFEWSQKYRVGIKTIDEQHQKLFELANEFIDALNKGRGKERLSETFDDLIEYTNSHFHTEETLFEQYNYPEKDAHVEEHKLLLKKVLDLNKNKTYIFPDNLADFLSSWLKDHIIESDLKFVGFFKNKGVK